MEASNRERLYLFTIVKGNANAFDTLTKPRKGFLSPAFIDRFNTYSFFIPRTRTYDRNDHILRGNGIGIERICEFLMNEGKNKQFYPVYDKKAFEDTLQRFDQSVSTLR